MASLFILFYVCFFLHFLYFSDKIRLNGISCESSFFSEKIRLGISCEPSARQMIYMKYQVLFSLKSKEKFRMSLLCNLALGALRAKKLHVSIIHPSKHINSTQGC